jgi:uncharacterized membrane protein YgdD (TMEM256/DUF423 family)
MNGLQDTWKTASNIHLFSAAALFGLAALLARLESRLLNWGAWFVVVGTIVFCGSIYLHVITGSKAGNLAPTGGFLMMTGWLLAAIGFSRKS